MTPLISYYGGKQRIARHIVKLIPQHTVYVEPFAGGATILFSKLVPSVSNSHHYREVINDLDSDLINMYRCFQNKETEQKLLKKLKFTLYSKEEWEKATNILKKKPTGLIDVERTWAYYICIMQSFSSLGSNWSYNIKANNLPEVWKNKKDLLPKVLDRFSGVYIEHSDAMDIIKKYDSSYTFFYCDPPYINLDQRYNSPKFKEEDLKRLMDTLNQCKGSFILSGYDTDIVSKEWERFEFNAVCSGFNHKNNNIANFRKEIVWRRFNKEQPEKWVQRLYNSGKYNCFVKHPDYKSEITLLQDSA